MIKCYSMETFHKVQQFIHFICISELELIDDMERGGKAVAVSLLIMNDGYLLADKEGNSGEK